MEQANAEQLKAELDSILEIAKNQLANKVRETIDAINKKEDSDERSILLYDYGICQPVYRETPFNEDLNECITTAWVGEDGHVVGFEVDSFGNEYDVSIDDLDVDMILYLLAGFENVSI